MNNPDSTDRIVSYFHALSRVPFSYKGQTYHPYDRLVVSNKVFRSYSCPSGCGACCMAVSLVWDDAPSDLSDRVEQHWFTIGDTSLPFWQYKQQGSGGRFCDFLNQSDGRCGVYSNRPLPCRFELFKFVHGVSSSTARAMVKLPGRNWALTRIDGQRGAQCEILPYDRALTETHIRDLRIIAGWMARFNLANDALAVVKYLETSSGVDDLRINRRERRGLID